MFGILYSIVAGISMSIQGVFNTRLSDKLGLWVTTTIVQGTGFVIALILAFFNKKNNLQNIGCCKKLYLLGGVLGIIITVTVIQGIKFLGPTHSIAIILVAQLATAALIDFWGLFDSQKISFTTNKILGLTMMVLGIILLKWKS
ncbi:DMT family transporter [Clostridium sp. AWRP]|uniref:DMT family transporter n=1 Tax=Clostridium sp. AWRP TaxID=2212991 RepID=UPI000FDB0883|nr:DMT family transporter [Clostridium sp. AWRP]AZV58881.1 DMT family transporter [Clostridium sp. AWRP]